MSEAKEAIRQTRAVRWLIDFASYIEPGYIVAPHLRLTADYLERVFRREVTRLMIFEPPRHGKSKLTSEIFPAWALGKRPDEQFMICSHTQSLSDTFSRNVRNLIALDHYATLFPRAKLSRDNATVQKWTLAGFKRPSMMSLGVGGSPTGQGAKTLIIDDPIGSAEDAESALQRDNAYRWYTDTIYPRLEPDAAIVLMMQRWHDDDLAGRLLKDSEAGGEKWVVLSLPAIAEANDAMGRAPGAALWPERYSVEALQRIKSVSPRSFDAKYQQRPRPAEGAAFKIQWLRNATIGAAQLPGGLRWHRYYDLAYSTKQTADNTATIAGALGADGVLYLRRGVAGRMESPEIRALITRIARDERDTIHGVEAAMHGVPVVQELARDPALAGIAIRGVRVTNDKMTRAAPAVIRAEAGKLKFVIETDADHRWIREWVDEMCAFPFGAHDDRVDTVSGVLQMIGNAGGGDLAGSIASALGR